MASGELSDHDVAAVVFRVLAALIALVAATAIVKAVDLRHDSGGSPPAPAPAGAATSGSAIGPIPGARVAGYVADRPAALAAATGTRAAVVSFTGYLDAGGARQSLAGVEIVRWFTASPGRGPQDADGSASPTDRVVFGAVVVGDAARLRAIAASPAIRLVDVGRDGSIPDPAGTRALRPEETDLVGSPATRP